MERVSAYSCGRIACFLTSSCNHTFSGNFRVARLLPLTNLNFLGPNSPLSLCTIRVGTLLLLRKQGIASLICNKRGEEKRQLPQHPLWQPEFPERMVKMKNSGNAPAAMWSSACFSTSRAAFLYSVLEVLITFLKILHRRLVHYRQKQVSNRKNMLEMKRNTCSNIVFY